MADDRERPISVRRTGARNWPWEARCRVHRDEELHLVDGIGAVEFNTRGVGNRLWIFAQIAADEHVKRHHPT
jgi:hypothetical protein